jgi:hypothetical protein
MPPVGLEPTISVLERAKTVRGLDRAATAIVFIFYFLYRRIARGKPQHRLETGTFRNAAKQMVLHCCESLRRSDWPGTWHMVAEGGGGRN